MDGEIDIYRHLTWLKRVNHRVPVNNETCQDRLTRLESDRECLVLQVSVLTDQVEAQGEKIRDLESCLEEHQLKLNTTEEMLQQELMSRATLESQKLDLMEEVTALKVKLSGIEKDRRESEDLQRSEAEIENLQEQLYLRDIEIDRLQSQLSSRASVQSDSSDREDVYRKKLKDKHQEVQKLKVGLDSLLAANEEKDLRIEELNRLLVQCKMMKQRMLMAQGSSEQILLGSSEEEESVCSKVATPTRLGHSEEIKPEQLSPSVYSIPVGLRLTPVEINTRSMEISHDRSFSADDGITAESHWAEPKWTSASLEELNSTRGPKRKLYLDDNKYQTLPGKLSPSGHLDKAEHFPLKQELAAVPSASPGGPDEWESTAANLSTYSITGKVWFMESGRTVGVYPDNCVSARPLEIGHRSNNTEAGHSVQEVKVVKKAFSRLAFISTECNSLGITLNIRNRSRSRPSGQLSLLHHSIRSWLI